MKRFLLTLVSINLLAFSVQAQIDSSLLKRTSVDTAVQKLNMDAMYNRPSVQTNKIPVSLGGYVEANYQRFGTDGVSDGDQFQFRRLSIFIASSVSKRIKFLSEIEFEPAEKSISVESAALDVEFHPLLNFRGGMIVNPIGAFNQNHDGPKWEFTDRPISATQMLPGTWSNAGFGLYGKNYVNDWLFGYEVYLSSSFDNSIIQNSENRTSLPASKENAERFEEIASGKALLTGKLAFKNLKIGELGLSYMGGAYNKFQADGFVLDDKRRLNVFAVDFNTTIRRTGTSIVGEYAWVFVNVPETYSQQFGNKQKGSFTDVIQPILQRPILGFKNAILNLAARFEYVDFNVGKFRETGGDIGDSLWSVTPAVSFRPTPQSVFRLNYRIQRQKDILGNPPENTAGISFGISSYF